MAATDISYYTSLILILCLFTEILCFEEDELYTCSGWSKRCLGENEKLGELNVIYDDLFNCYFGFSPTCTEKVNEEIDNKTEFCVSLHSKSKYSLNLESCKVEAQLVEEDDNQVRKLVHDDL